MFMTSCVRPQHVNSLWPRDAIWWHRSGSTLAQVMSCCLNQCWLIISEIFWHSLKAFNRKYTRYLSLTYWGRVMHICISKITIIGSDNGLSPARRQAIIWTNAGILLIGPWETNFSEILIGIHTFSFKKIHLKMSSGKWRPFCLGLNVFIWVQKLLI